ncbi:MAG: TetR/AcrR family transcriptional regulator [Lachnospiraceae bacterium]|nr:TetR/AcrR family transcriptional regulator [Lachnospiraceae bacterium]
MYEGCNKTALTSQAAIADALLTIMKSKPYNRISVSEICKCAGVSRQTFYSLFVSKDDVISCVLARNYCFRLEEQDCCSASMSLEEICRAYSYYITQTRDILDLLVANDIMYLMQDSLYRSFITCHSYLPDHTKEDRIYAADFLAGGLTGIARNYVLQGRDTSRDHLEDILYSLFNGSFFR